jgi:DnaJ-class molecular chaperone
MLPAPLCAPCGTRCAFFWVWVGRLEKALSDDPYKVLGVAKDASQEDIQKAYRALAKKLHPDLNPGNKSSEERFKQVTAAYDLVGDPEKRARYDRGEIDASGAERPPRGFYRDHAGAAADRYASSEGFADIGGGDDVFAELFRRGDRGNVRMRGANAYYRLELDFLDAVNGSKQQVTLPDGSVLDVTIPAGTRDGQILRLRGKGHAGLNGGPPGDALVEIGVRPHRTFTRKDDDIHVELPLPLREAVLGGKVNVPTPDGSVAMTVPKWSNTGSVLRLKGKGVPRRDGSRGDEYVTLKVMLPAKPDAELEKLITQWRGEQGDSARKSMEA